MPNGWAAACKDQPPQLPQSGELIRGRENRRAILANYAGAGSGLGPTTTPVVGSDDQFITGPSWNIIHLAGSGDEMTLTGTIDYPDLGTWHFATLLTLREGKIWRQVDYFAAPFDAPAWRALRTSRLRTKRRYAEQALRRLSDRLRER